MDLEVDETIRRTLQAPDVSLVVPARDEVGNISPLVAEVLHAMTKTGLDYELILVDDGSVDATTTRIRAEVAARTWVLGVALEPAGGGRAQGQSAALREGLRVARGATVVTLDADLQDDPAEIPRLLELLDRTGVDMVQGDRTATRRDSLAKRLASQVGRIARRSVLGDTIHDTGCSLRVFRRGVIGVLPLEFCGMHRFVPFIARLNGYTVIETPVVHRPRTRGRSKYGLLDRAFSGLRDLLALRWMRARIRRPEVRWLDGERGSEE